MKAPFRVESGSANDLERVLLFVFFLLLPLLAACGVKSDPAWPGGVWGDSPSPPVGASADKSAFSSPTAEKPVERPAGGPAKEAIAGTAPN